MFEKFLAISVYLLVLLSIAFGIFGLLSQDKTLCIVGGLILVGAILLKFEMKVDLIFWRF